MLKDIEPISTSSTAVPEASQPKVQICFPVFMLYPEAKNEESLQLPPTKQKINLCFQMRKN